MQVAYPFDDETRRLAALHALDLLDTEPEAEFDALVALAAQLLDCPMALLTLVDRDRQWVKARAGEVEANVCRTDAICDHTIRDAAPLVVETLLVDPRFTGNPLVAAPGGLRFYAGAPIHAAADGKPRAIGAVCVLDHHPRDFDAACLATLERLATIAEALIASRALARSAVRVAREREQYAAGVAQRDRTLRQAERIAQIGSWRYDLLDGRLDWSEGASRVHALDGPPLNVSEALDHYPPDARARVSAALAHTIETGAPFDIEEDFITARGDRRRLHAMAELEHADGRPAAIVGVLQDVTDRYALECRLRRTADTDPLTGVGNRAAFGRQLDAALHRHRTEGTPLLLALVDLDGFKAINDTLGHLAGDDVLRHVGSALGAPWLMGSAAARLGGDEFALVVENPMLAAEPERLRALLESALRLPVVANGISMTAAGTVGVAVPSPDGHGARELIQRADADLYAAKRARVGDRRGRERRAG